LIRFAFYGEPQDYEFFIRSWWDDATVSESLGEVADSLTPYGVADMLDEGVFLAAQEVEFALRRLRAKRNLILQGAPGVGKTFIAKRLAYALMGAVDDRRVAVVQFHPSYSYEDFIRGYRPTSQAGQFVLVDGPFLRHCHSADQDPDRPYVVLVDEINRANLSQVFGELFMLLESDKRGKGYVSLPRPSRDSARVEASDSCTPNQTSMMVASAMHMRTPKASIVGDAVAVSASHPWVIQFSTPIHHLARVHRRSIGQGLCATVVGRRNVCLIGARVVRSVLESRL